jgi:hypothetical protein
MGLPSCITNALYTSFTGPSKRDMWFHGVIVIQDCRVNLFHSCSGHSEIRGLSSVTSSSLSSKVIFSLLNLPIVAILKVVLNFFMTLLCTYVRSGAQYTHL